MGKKGIRYSDDAWLYFVKEWSSADREVRVTGVFPGESTEKEQEHVCSYVNVGFQFDKWVCKDCDKEKPS